MGKYSDDLFKVLVKARKKDIKINEKDKHPTLVTHDEMKAIWNIILKTETVREKLSIFRCLCTTKIFSIEQFNTFAKLCKTESERIEILEIFLLSLTGVKQKYTLLNIFSVATRSYVKEYILDMSFDKEPDKNSMKIPPMIVRNLRAKKMEHVREIDSILKNSRFSTDQVTVVSQSVSTHCEIMNHKQATKLLLKWIYKKDKFIQMLHLLRYNVTGFTCKETGFLLKRIKDVTARFEIFEEMLDFLIDTENRWIALEIAFFFEKESFAHKVMEKKLINMCTYPRSAIFGKIQGKRMIFVIPTISNMDIQFVTTQNERIDRFRFMIRDLCRILKEQLSEYCYFDVIVYGATFASWSKRGLRRVNDQNVDECCEFLRNLKTRGHAALEDGLFDYIFDIDNYEKLDHIYFICNEPPDILENHLFDVNVQRRKYLDHFPTDGLKCAIHTCAIFLGQSESDELRPTTAYLIRLSNMTNGTHLTAVLPDFIRQPNWIERHVDVKRHVVRRWMGQVYQMLNILTYIAMLLSVTFARGSYLGGQTCGDVFRKYATYISPHTSFMSMWRTYIVLNGVLVMTLSLPSGLKSQQGIISRVETSIAMHNMLLGTFLLLWQNEYLIYASMILGLAVAMLAFTYKRLEVGVRSTGRLTYKERIFIWSPLSFMMSWMSFNLVVTIASALKKYEWNGFGWQFEWAIVMVLGLSCLTVYIIFHRSDLVFGLTMSLCFLSISAAQWNQYRSLGVLTAEVKMGGSFWLMVFTFLFAAILACLSITSLSALVIRMFYKPLWRQRMVVVFTVVKQFGNATFYFAMIVINLLAAPWGYRMLGMKGTPPLNHRTCGLVARDLDAPEGNLASYKASLTIMPHHATFKMFFIIYAWIGCWVLIQLLPHESLLRSRAYHQKKDKDLQQVLMIRGPQTEWEYIRLPICNKFIKFPRLHKWQLTVLAYQRWITGIGNYFMYSCFFNICFLLFFLFRIYWCSLLSCYALLYSLVKLYKKSGAFPQYIEQVSQDEIDREHEEFLEKHIHWDEVKREVKWRRILRRLSRKNEYTSPLEFYLLHLPLSFYIGLVSFMAILSTSHYIVSASDHVYVYIGDWVEQGWSTLVLWVFTFVIIGVSYGRADPMMSLSFALCLWGVVYENTSGTCEWYLPAGLKVRKPAAVRMNQLARNYPFFEEEYRELKTRQFGGEIGGRLMWFWNLTDGNGNELGFDHPDGEKWCKYWVEKGGADLDGNPWAFRHTPLHHQGRHLTYYVKDEVPDGDYKWHFGRCRRIFKDIDGNPVNNEQKCKVVGQQDEKQMTKRTVKGYTWLIQECDGCEGLCVEDPRTCGFSFPPGNANMITVEYEMAEYSILAATLLSLVSIQLMRKLKELQKNKRLGSEHARATLEDSSEEDETSSDEETKG